MLHSGYSPNISKKYSKTNRTFREATLRVRVISKMLVAAKKHRKGRREAFIFTSTPSRAGLNLPKSHGINPDLQSPRNRLLYFIYSAPNSKIKAAPGVKSSISSVLGYKSDGHFHYDWNYLMNAEMIEEKQGYFLLLTHEKRNLLCSQQSRRTIGLWL